MNDSMLMQQIAQGSAVAFKTLLEKYITAIIAFIRRYRYEMNDAEDISQEVFTRVWQHAASWQASSGTVKSWIYKIAYNLCMDEFRKRKTLNEFVELTETTTPEDLVLQSIQMQKLQFAIDKLPERQRTALWLCAYEGLSNKEAADILKVSVHALESLLARARRDLRSRLQSEEDSLHEHVKSTRH